MYPTDPIRAELRASAAGHGTTEDYWASYLGIADIEGPPQ
jgi:hypothetical protein